MSVVQARLGTFAFEARTAAFDELRRSTAQRIASQERLTGPEGLQYLGPGTDNITLAGVVYPHHSGGLGQIDKLRALADTGKPQRLVDSRGNVLGRWMIDNVEETQSAMLAGLPRRQSFSVSLRRYRE